MHLKINNVWQTRSLRMDCFPVDDGELSFEIKQKLFSQAFCLLVLT